MFHSRTWLLIALVILIPACESRSPPPARWVHGQVTYGEENLWDGRVTFEAEDGRIGTTPIQSDGSYEIINPPLGRVRVAVFHFPQGSALIPPKSNHAKGPIKGRASSSAPLQPELLLPKRFHDSATSPLTYVVEPGQHRFDIKLSPEAGDPPVVNKDSVKIGIKVGQVAPEIEGDDLDGRFFKLSEQRGKVVVLLFWGHWCRLCHDQYPHERTLVERLNGKHAVVLGVNSDEDRGLIATQNARHQINWRSWWDGEMWGSVARTWQLPGWPGVFVIDAQGVIRAVNPLGAELDRVVDELLVVTP